VLEGRAGARYVERHLGVTLRTDVGAHSSLRRRLLHYNRFPDHKRW
jgi:hypothetical protein